MIVCIANLLAPAELDFIRQALDQATFVDGSTTAGWAAHSVKHTTQIKRDDPNARELYQLIFKVLGRIMPFQQVAFPKVVHSILFSRYTEGMAYGQHIDNPIMGDGQQLARSDISWTLFLNDPSEYEGGELLMDSSQGQKSIKLPSGSLVVYPSTTLHQVTPITQGERLVAVGWVQSMIREPAERELLYDLDVARRNLFNKYGKTQEFDLITKCCANLHRRLADV